jgi:hypothetical protein
MTKGDKLQRIQLCNVQFLVREFIEIPSECLECGGIRNNDFFFACFGVSHANEAITFYFCN